MGAAKPAGNAEPNASGSPRSKPDADTAHRAHVASLTPEERLLLTLRVQLYQNSWDVMAADLRDRLEGKPYIFKLVNRIEEDLTRIDKMRSYEKKHGIDLYDYLEGDEE